MCFFFYLAIVIIRRDSSVRIATFYGLDGPGIESRWWARFSAHVQTFSWAHPATYNNGHRVISGGKAEWTWL